MKNSFDINSYDYFLPEKLIAQEPIKNRSCSKLLVLNTIDKTIEHKEFNNIIQYLNKGDVLVLNNTKVLPCRVYGTKYDTNAKIEVLLLKKVKTNIWQCLTSPQKRLKEGTLINFSNKLKGQVIKIYKEGITDIKFIYSGSFTKILEELGNMPLPPYIHKKLKDKNRYQTIYAKKLGSAAAPTAGLHFTEKLLCELKEKGVELLYITLHVGLGTFKPVNSNDIRNHQMHSEYYEINKEACKKLQAAKRNNKNIICVGTTSLRALESNYTKYNEFKATKEETKIFIYPGYHFKAIDSLITNFHLPKSTLLMLVSALAGRKNIMTAYKEAIEKQYRFFSFGDAMFINNINCKSKYKNILENYNLKNSITFDNFKIDIGTNNVMLSAPHAYKHLKKDKIKKNENNTEKIVKIVGSLTNSHIIYTYKSGSYDHNYESTAYKKELSKYIKNNNIKYLIDIHGLSETNIGDIEVGTNNYKNIDKGTIDKILKILNKYYTNILVDKYFKASKENRIANYIATNNKIKTIQLEINKKYRCLNSKSKTFSKTIDSLIKIIELLKEEK